MVLPKPKEGDPCNGCGVCCAAEPCTLAKMVRPDVEAPCPFMAKTGERYSCVFIDREREAGLPPKLAEALGIGRGCDSESPEGSTV